MPDATTVYKLIIHGIQALRRQAELKQCPVLGGTGIRAFCYPHQLYVVREVLCATQIRHLLADEVGLGKTLEALMIMNALRIRNNGKLRVSIVVGSEERAIQWRDEICGRFPFPFWKNLIPEKYPTYSCNNNVFFTDHNVEWRDEAFENDDYDDVMLFSPPNFDENKEYLEPEYCDLLILDEIHGFSNELLNFLASRSSDYQNIIVLSATPLLGEEKDILQLLKLLSPEYAEFCELRKETPNIADDPTLQNRMLRSKRLTFPKALPQRASDIIRIEPFESDRLRFAKVRNLMQKMVAEGLVTEENAVLFIRRSVTGGQTLYPRVDKYKRRYPRYAAELTELQKLCSSEQGDSRFDALVDYLLEFFADDDGTKKIVIASQDMPTIKYLEKRLKSCFPSTKILLFEQERNLRDENDAESGTDTKKSETQVAEDNKGIVEQFWTGDAQILIAHNDARESFNLQIADALVFFSIPWNPVDMEQWLGRVSRLGLRKKKTIEIITLVQRDFIDEEIADLYQQLNMFEKPLDIEKNQNILNTITEQIRRRVLDGTNQISKPKLEYDEWHEEIMHIVQRDFALELDDNVQRTVLEPVISPEKLGDFPKEDALNGWLDLLRNHEFRTGYTENDENYKYAKNPNYYKFQVTWKPRKCPMPIPVLEDEPISKKPFILYRKHIQLPPRDLVPVYPDKEKRGQRYEVPLQFFNFGSQLHDKLVKIFADFFQRPSLYQFSVLPGKSTSTKVDAGKYLIGICTTDRKREEPKQLLDGLSTSDNKTQSEMRESEEHRFLAGLQSDDRFLDLLFPGGLEIHGYKDSLSNRIEPEQFYGLLTALPTIKGANGPTSIPAQYVEKISNLAIAATQNRWQRDFQSPHELLETRLETLRQELQIRIDLIEYKIRVQEEKIKAEKNPQTIRLNYEPVKKLLLEQLLLAKRHFELRKEYLTTSIEMANSPYCECKAVLRIIVQPQPSTGTANV
ncbi:MAG: helicase-related protein [Thermoguttaceae bacterium]